VSRQSLSTWKRRYLHAGLAGPADQPKRPLVLALADLGEGGGDVVVCVLVPEYGWAANDGQM
jgi:hypothetical protein